MQRFSTPDEAEAGYYKAFSKCDADAMARVWAEDDVICIHPGGRAIVDRGSIIRSWESIFNNSSGAKIEYAVVRQWVADDLAVHLVSEELTVLGTETVVVLATNVYRRIADNWFMVEHHASLVQRQGKARTLQ